MNIFSNIVDSYPTWEKLYERTLCEVEKSMIDECKFIMGDYGPQVEFTYKSPANGELVKHLSFLCPESLENFTDDMIGQSLNLDKIKVAAYAFSEDGSYKDPIFRYKIKY